MTTAQTTVALPKYGPIRAWPNEYSREITELPLRVKEFSVLFIAEGVLLPAKYTKEHAYIGACMSRGVIPYSGITLEYDHEARMFVHCWKIDITNSQGQTRAAQKLLLKGGRIHQIAFAGREFAAEGFAAFCSDHLEAMLDNDYYINHAWMDLTSARNKRVGQVRFDEHKGIELLATQAANSLELRSMETWYDGLRKKHEGQ